MADLVMEQSDEYSSEDDDEQEESGSETDEEDDATESEPEFDRMPTFPFLDVSSTPGVSTVAVPAVSNRLEDERIVERPNLAVGADVVSDGIAQPTPGYSTTAARFTPSSPIDSSFSDFKSPKTKKLQNTSGAGDSGDESETCPICFEPWTNTSSHRLASLKCGHLFGKSCIMKWLKGHPGKCPQCNAKAHCRDIRVLFARTVKVVDTSERDRALKELELEREARKKAEIEASRTRFNYQTVLSECSMLRQELEQQKQQLEMLRKMPSNSIKDLACSQTSSQNSTASPYYVFEKLVKIYEPGGCRVMAYCSAMAMLCVSQPSASPLFPGFGVKKLSSLDFKSAQYVSIHSKPIRDLCFNTRHLDSVLLSCSIDKTIKLTSLISNQIIHSYECSAPVWSCAWNLDDKNYFYAGQHNGGVSAFDIRNLSTPVAELNQDGSRSPVVSLHYLPQVTGTKLRPGGLLIGRLDRCEFHERRPNNDYKMHLLSLEANLTCLSLEEKTGHVLASYRPNNRHPNIRHQLCEVVIEPEIQDSSAMACRCNLIHGFQGGSTQKLLTKNRLIVNPDDPSDILACIGDEASQSFQIWQATSGNMLQKLVVSDSVLDICPVVVNDQSFLVSLTDKQINVYRHQSTWS